MDWDLAIKRNRIALLRIVATLFALVGIVPGGGFLKTLRRGDRNKALFALRPAESALRRLIFCMARRIEVSPSRSRKPPSRSSRTSSQTDRRNTPGKDRSAHIPAFRLIDPRKDFSERRRARPDPVIWAFPDPDEPVPYCILQQRRAEEAALRQRLRDRKRQPSPDDEVSGERLCKRLQSLQAALHDLPKQAVRMARLMARRDQAPPGKGRIPPMRPGWPPGYRQRALHPVDLILKECHSLAVYAREYGVCDAPLKPG